MILETIPIFFKNVVFVFTEYDERVKGVFKVTTVIRSSVKSLAKVLWRRASGENQSCDTSRVDCFAL